MLTWVRGGVVVVWLLRVVALLVPLPIPTSMLVLMVLATVLIACFMLVLMAYHAVNDDEPDVARVPVLPFTVSGLLVLVPLLPLAFLAYVFYQVFLDTLGALLLLWGLPLLFARRHTRHTVGLGMLIGLGLGLIAWSGHPRVNFVLTVPIRQQIVDRVIQRRMASPDGTPVTDMSVLERLVVRRATAYDDEGTVAVYFPFYKGGLDAAFVVYTQRPHSREFQGRRLVPLAEDWIFFRRGYAH